MDRLRSMGLLSMDALTLVRAYGLQYSDPIAEVRRAFPDATPDIVTVGREASRWRDAWDKRFNTASNGSIPRP